MAFFRANSCFLGVDGGGLLLILVALADGEAVAAAVISMVDDFFAMLGAVMRLDIILCLQVVQ